MSRRRGTSIDSSCWCEPASYWFNVHLESDAIIDVEVAGVGVDQAGSTPNLVWSPVANRPGHSDEPAGLVVAIGLLDESFTPQELVAMMTVSPQAGFPYDAD
jgi:hypothetical protein